jgi:hypothetical protein
VPQSTCPSEGVCRNPPTHGGPAPLIVAGASFVGSGWGAVCVFSTFGRPYVETALTTRNKGLIAMLPPPEMPNDLME